MRVSIATQPGGLKPNEDWVMGAPNLAIVLDGLSTAGLDTGCRHGVPWYVANLGGQLLAALAASDLSLAAGFALALEKVASLHPECDLKNPGTPSSTVSILRENQDHLDYLILADSPIVFEEQNEFTMITDLSVDGILPEMRAETERYATGSPEHRESVARLITAQRLTRNVADGYWVAASTPEAAEHVVTGRKNRSEVTSAALLSDGASCIVTDYKVASWSEVFNTLQTEGTEGLIDTIRKLEASDPDGQRWPRYKASDDAAVAYCRF